MFFPSDSTFGVANGINKSSAKLRPAFAFIEALLRKMDLRRWNPSLAGYEDAELVEKVDGNGDEQKREGITGGSDDSRDDDYGQKGRTAIATHETGIYQTETAKKPTDYRQLEDDTQHETEHGECVDVTLKGDEVADFATDLISAQELKGEGEDDKVAEEYAYGEHDVGTDDDANGQTTLLLIESGGNETEQLVEDVGHGANEPDIEGDHHVYDELPGDCRVDELQIVGLGIQNNSEDLVLEDEGHHHEHKCYGQTTDDDSPKFVEMIPKGHERTEN